MTSAIAHRGPDDLGYWIDAEAGIALGHRRLSIIDLYRRTYLAIIVGDDRAMAVMIASRTSR